MRIVTRIACFGIGIAVLFSVTQSAVAAILVTEAFDSNSLRAFNTDCLVFYSPTPRAVINPQDLEATYTSLAASPTASAFQGNVSSQCGSSLDVNWVLNIERGWLYQINPATKHASYVRTNAVLSSLPDRTQRAAYFHFLLSTPLSDLSVVPACGGTCEPFHRAYIQETHSHTLIGLRNLISNKEFQLIVANEDILVQALIEAVTGKKASFPTANNTICSTQWELTSVGDDRATITCNGVAIELEDIYQMVDVHNVPQTCRPVFIIGGSGRPGLSWDTGALLYRDNTVSVDLSDHRCTNRNGYVERTSVYEKDEAHLLSLKTLSRFDKEATPQCSREELQNLFYVTEHRSYRGAILSSVSIELKDIVPYSFELLDVKASGFRCHVDTAQVMTCEAATLSAKDDVLAELVVGVPFRIR